MTTISTALDIRVASTADEARAALADGYEPVECAFGSESVVGPLGLDHHGELSHRPPVSALAYTLAPMSEGCVAHDARSVRGKDLPTRFVAHGVPDADASLAIAVMVGLIDPHDDPTEESVVGHIVRLVAASDVGGWKDLTQEGRAGAIILAWGSRQRARGPFPSLSPAGVPPSCTCGECLHCEEWSTAAAQEDIARDAQAARWVSAVNDWAELLALPWEEPRPPEPCNSHRWVGADPEGCGECSAAYVVRDPELSDAIASEAERVAKARAAKITPYGVCAFHGPTEAHSLGWADDNCPLGCDMIASVALIESPVMGAPIWYADHPNLRGYVAYWETPAGGAMCISLRPGTAKGDPVTGGLRQLRYSSPEAIGGAYDSTEESYVAAISAPRLPDGVDGRPEILGSRGVKITRDDAVRAAKLLAERIDEVAAHG